MSTSWITRSRLLTLAIVLVLLGGLFTVLRGGAEPMRAVVFFPRAVHLYAGSDVSVLGVRVGEVTKVEPVGDRVRVELAYDREQKVPADAQAAIVSPTLVADRYVQLLPVYAGGPTLKDGGTIPLARGQVPVELDEVFASLKDLATALGPEGANAKGALSDLISVGAKTLDGNGERAGTALHEVSKLTGTLSDNRTKLFQTVRSLQLFTSELAAKDATVAAFSQDLAKVSGQLANERDELAAALHALALTLNKVATFLRDNRNDLTANVKNLAKVMAAVESQKENLGKVLDIAPTGIANFTHLYNPTSRALNGRINGNTISENPASFVCALYGSLGAPPEQCAGLLAPLTKLPLPTGAGAK